MFHRLVNTRFGEIKLNLIDWKYLELRQPKLNLKKMFGPFFFLPISRANLHGEGSSFFFLVFQLFFLFDPFTLNLFGT